MANIERTRLMVIFPYGAKGTAVHERLAALLEWGTNERGGIHSSGMKPLLVVHRDSEKAFHAFAGKHKDLVQRFEVLFVWSVDTSQMWLHGWGNTLDANRHSRDKVEVILQLPGDLEQVAKWTDFKDQVNTMVSRMSANHMVVGTFDLEPGQAKYLIDCYGTLPLLGNWFPKMNRQLRSAGITRPRSEFLALSTDFLKAMLQHRKFAYEQTLAFLVYAYDPALQPRRGRWNVSAVNLGSISDYDQHRGFREAIDQVERTERLLRLLWRERNGGNQFDVKEFDGLNRNSNAIRDAFVVIARNALLSS